MSDSLCKTPEATNHSKQWFPKASEDCTPSLCQFHQEDQEQYLLLLGKLWQNKKKPMNFVNYQRLTLIFVLKQKLE